MDKQPVGQLPDLTQSNNDDEIMVITDSEHNQLKKEKISDFITDLTSTDENNAIVKGTDGKLFTKDFGNASNITEGTLPVEVLPSITTDMLPASGVTEGSYRYPSSVTVNEKGQVTEIVEGQGGGGGGSDVDNRYTNGIMGDKAAEITYENRAANYSSINNPENLVFFENYGIFTQNTSYLQMLPPAQTINSNFEMVVKFKTPSSFPNNEGGSQSAYYHFYGYNYPSKGIGHTVSLSVKTLNIDGTTHFRSYIRYGEESGYATAIELVGTYNVLPDTVYWLKLSYNTETGYTLSYSLNGSVWETDTTSSDIRPPIALKTGVLGLSIDAPETIEANPPQFIVYPKESYITIDGVGTWSGNSDDYLIVNNGATISGEYNDQISGFSESNYLTLNRTFPELSSVVCRGHFNVTGLVGTQVIFGMPTYENSISLINGKLSLVYNGNILSGDTNIKINTDYLFELSLLNGVYTLKLAEGLNTEGLAEELTLPSDIQYFGGKTINLGWGGNNYSNYYLKGAISLGNVFISRDNNIPYWNFFCPFTHNTSILKLSGTVELNCPNGRNSSDNTFENIKQEINLNNIILYNPLNGKKDLLISNDGEIFLPPEYKFVDNQDMNEESELNAIHFDAKANKHYVLKTNELNFINTGIIVNNGIVSGFGASRYLGLPSTYTLGDEFNISLAVTNDADITTKQALLSSDGINAVIENGAVSVSFRRADVTVVQRVITLGTSYQVTSETLGTTGYVKAAGDASATVATGLDLYVDPECTESIGTTDNSYTYTGSSGSITEQETGYVEFGGVGTVANGTNVYNDANLTDLAGQATGTDWVFTDDTAESIICTLSDTLTASTAQVIKISCADDVYSLQIDDNEAKTYNSTSPLIANIQIHIGSDGTTFYKGTVDLNTSEFSMWTWNGVSALNPNLTFVGNLTNNNGVFSGFSAQNYALIEQIPSGVESFEFVIKFTTGANITDRQTLLGNDLVNATNPQIAFMAADEAPDGSKDVASLLQAIAPISSGTWGEGVYTLEKLQANTSYIAKYVWNNSTKNETLYLSTNNGLSFEEQDTSTLPSLYWTGNIRIGVDIDKCPWLGSIDLNETYIKVNGAIVWRWNGLTESKSQWQEVTLAKVGGVTDNGTQITEADFDESIFFISNSWMEQILKSINSDISETTEQLSTLDTAKANIDFSNATKPYVTTVYRNGKNGYILFNNNYCIQWGMISHSMLQRHSDTITLIKKYNNTNYVPVAVQYGVQSDNSVSACGVTGIGSTSFTYYHTGGASGVVWFAGGVVS